MISASRVQACLAFLLLVGLGTAGRLYFETPNFTPLAAVALFAGYYFRHRLIAVAVPLFTLALSDLFMSRHASWGVMVTVYLALCFPVLLGCWLRAPRSTFAQLPLRTAAALLLPSLVFYLSTNLAVWFFDTLYPTTAAGLAACYVQALPFYRWFLQGDLLFIPLVFGAYLASSRLVAATKVRWLEELSAPWQTVASKVSS
ncbi:MAG: hypothetical protein DWQ31_20440 [Planctomycetota bacterium]|nr:MAG: hypothetical protein DWQ31_20440 [Planctomycetota bacterium]REJ92736.1 MAG: hypothetical protein DWQ35_11905 [Planctomycetota bacterium]REK23774.1 MAG: hypothetical protein DWQ42_14875 [Planctomycetota bacterium]REK47627.1 MAG: hypothetical protein DWQ46_04155 [Planctomycetota bacterium]